MRKFIRGMLVVTALSAGMGTMLTSCKDTDDDLHNEYVKDLLSVEGQLNTLKGQLENLETAQASCKAMCEAKQAELEAKIQALNTALAGKADSATVEALRQDVTNAAAAAAQAQAQYTQLSNTVTNLQNTVTTLATQAALKDSVDALRAIIATLSQTVETTGSDVKDALENYEQKNDSVVNELQNQINNLGAAANDSLKNAFLNFETKVNNFMTSSTASITALNTAMDSVRTVLKGFEDVKNKANDAYAKAVQNENKLGLLSNKVDSLEGVFNTRDRVYADSLRILDKKIQDNIIDIQNLQNSLAGVEADIRALYGSRDSLATITLGLGTRLAEAEATIMEHTTAIQEVNSRVDNLMANIEGRLDGMITSMSLESTFNPVFGTFSTPFGLNSSVLMAYYGMTPSGDVDFPTTDLSVDYRRKDADITPVLTSKDLQMLNATVKSYGGTYVQGEEDGEYHGNAGTVFFRVNPGTVDMTGKTFSLVNTRDEESGVKLENVQKSTTELRFGYNFGRSQSTNGFYQAYATLTPENVYSTKVEIEEGLGSSFKEVLSGLADRKISGGQLAELAKLLYDQFNGILPANAIKAEWTYPDANGVDHLTSVYSQSQIAATCFKPLAFDFLYGKSFRNIPLFDPLTEFDILNPDDFSLNLKLDPIQLTDPNITIHLDNISLDNLGEIVVSGDVVDESGVVIGHLENVVVDTDSFSDAIENAINQSIDGWNAEIKNQLETQIKQIQDDIQEQINEMLDSISGQIDSQLKDLISQINTQFKNKVGNYFDRMNDFISVYNRLAGRINRFLSNPNHYLQPIMLYKGNDGFHMLSGNINRPSKFKLAGGNSIYLYPTTRTGEIIVPTFKKFVGVTNVWKTSDASVSAQNGNAAAKSLLDQANANKDGNMDKVFNGQELHVAFSVPQSAKGYTYEIVYQALDYHGLISTMKAYVTIE